MVDSHTRHVITAARGHHSEYDISGRHHGGQCNQSADRSLVRILAAFRSIDRRCGGCGGISSCCTPLSPFCLTLAL